MPMNKQEKLPSGDFFVTIARKIVICKLSLEKEKLMKVYQHVNIVTCDQDFHVYLDGILAVKESQIVYVGQEN